MTNGQALGDFLTRLLGVGLIVIAWVVFLAPRAFGAVDIYALIGGLVGVWMVCAGLRVW